MTHCAFIPRSGVILYIWKNTITLTSFVFVCRSAPPAPKWRKCRSTPSSPQGGSNHVPLNARELLGAEDLSPDPDEACAKEGRAGGGFRWNTPEV